VKQVPACLAHISGGVRRFSEGDQPTDLRDGHMSVLTAPGWGCDLDEEAARKHAYD
jgi:L-alanine-DL-glutamate epimerase-like enolase superfamily enzyme